MWYLRRMHAQRRRLVRAESRARTRGLLLDAAAEVFGRLGYEGASLEAVADAAGFSKGAVYSNFASKASLFEALLDRVIEGRTAAAKALFGDLPLAQIVAELGNYMRTQAARERTWDLLTFEFWLAAMRDATLRGRLAAAWRAVRADLGALVAAKLAAEGLAAPFTAIELATIIQSIGTGLIVQYYLDPEHVDPALFTRAIQRILPAPAVKPRKAPTKARRG